MRSTSQAIVLPTSQGTSQSEVATVPPTVSVSPSVSAPQIPSTSQPQQLDPTAAEFFPTGREGSSEAREAVEEPPRAVVTPRQDQPQSSTSRPSLPPARQSIQRPPRPVSSPRLSGRGKLQTLTRSPALMKESADPRDTRRNQGPHHR